MQNSSTHETRDNKIAVIGAGVIGQGVAYVFAKHGYKVTLIDKTEEVLNKSAASIRNIARHDLLLQGNGVAVNTKAITYTTNYEELRDCCLIIENVTEIFEAKEIVYKAARDLISNDALVAVNTSANSITKIASYLRRPENVVGIHFMNPVHLTKAAEVIRGQYTSEASLAKAMEYLKTLKINAIVVNDWVGFVSNRVLMLTINEAICVFQDKVANAADIDRIFRECLGHKMGPLETADLIGLDTILHTLDVLFEEYLDTKFRAAPLLRRMVDAKICGRKTGQGFYKY